MKDSLCYQCKKNKAGKPSHTVTLSYQMMEVNVFNIGGLCYTCLETDWIEEFKQNAEEFITAVGGKVKVDWQGYNKHFAMGRFHDQKERFHSILTDLGILSPEAQGNWEIVADGPIGINPRASLSYLYFVRKEDAVEFARLEKARTLYHWEIHHIDEVISKQEVIETNNKVVE